LDVLHLSVLILAIFIRRTFRNKAPPTLKEWPDRLVLFREHHAALRTLLVPRFLRLFLPPSPVEFKQGGVSPRQVEEEPVNGLDYLSNPY
jgi:hypothetical protein